ncbi:response regulator [Tumidithrix elongata RA019]|uniref:Response regulator n=1 Tax=Tumidithrix elongata BACA0141 TaxID=2716417 RepID=A0AAW9PV83_9CYAN|nr:response regulator [Tumidithrix elongata RA019]
MTEPKQSSGTILAVDDNPTNLSVLVDLLKADGFKVLVADRGELAIKQLQRVQPDMILLDVMMPPGIDGFETCRRIKANPETQDIPVIFMTALSDTSNKLEGFSVGAIDYLTKPIDGEEVLARVRTHLAIDSLRKTLIAQNSSLQTEASPTLASSTGSSIGNPKLLREKFTQSFDTISQIKPQLAASYWELLASLEQNLKEIQQEILGDVVENPKPKQPAIEIDTTGIINPWRELLQNKITLEQAIATLVDPKGNVALNLIDAEISTRFTKEFKGIRHLPALIPLLLWQGYYYLGCPIEIPDLELQKLSDLIRVKIKLVRVSAKSCTAWFAARFNNAS